MKSKYTVKIDAGDTFYRFAYADEPLEREEYYSSGIEVGVYLPYLKDFDQSNNEIDLEGENSIPEISMSAYDPTNEIYNNLRDRNLDYETLEAVIHKKVGSDSYKKVFDGYLTDVSDGGSFVDLTVRKSEKQNIKNIFDRFSYDSFQKIVTRSPSDVLLDPVWSASDEIGWELAKGYYYASDVNPRDIPFTQKFALRMQSRDGVIDSGQSTLKVTIPLGNPGWSNFYKTWSYSAQEEKVVRDSTDKKLFEDPDGGGTAKIAVGWPNSRNFEIVSYNDLTINGDTLEFTLENSMSNNHWSSPVPIRPFNQTGEGEGTFDEVWIDTKGKLPVDKNNELIDDPNIDAGFINIGGMFSKEGGIGYGVKNKSNDLKTDVFPIFRYEIDKNSLYGNYVKLKIHTVVQDVSHDLAVDHRATQYPLVTPSLGTDDSEEEPDDKVYKVKFRWVVRQMDFPVKNMTPDGLSGSFEDELRGVRIDLEGEFDNYEIIREGGVNKNEEDYSQVNTNLVNNATEKFGVVSSSELVEKSNGNYVTRLHFDLPDRLNTDWRPVLRDDPEHAVAINDADHYKKVERDKNLSDQFMNYLVYEPEYNSLDELRNDPKSELLEYENAKRFFLTNKYRYFLNPVPRDSNHLGKVFPIVYGYVNKVPMLHVMSKMRFDQGDETAGDDYYVYSSHACDVNDPTDITIHYKDNDRQESPSKGNIEKDTPGIQNARTYYEIAKNPFPKVVENHYEQYFLENGEREGIRSVDKIENPYHALEELQTINGEFVKAVQLQGHKWNAEVGKLDARYPIRNGFGTSTLYASFGGYISQGGVDVPEGELIEHPLDIIYHFVMKYGRYSGNQNTAEKVFDLENIRKVKAKTRKYKFGVYINEEVNLFELITKICKQAGFYWYFDNGKINFSLGEQQNVQSDKPIVHGLNVVGEVTQQSEGYKDFYDEVRYKYEKDYINDGYKKEVLFNGLNNELCARSSKVLANTNAFELEADWVYSPYVAKEVASRYVERLCRRRFTYNVKVKKGVGDIDEFDLLDYVPMSVEDYNLDRTPVLVTSVKDESTFQELTVVEFRDV